MLSDADSKKKKKSLRARSIYDDTNKQWSDKQKMEAVQSYLLLGNLALTARILGIPEVTLRYWKNTSWWQDVVQEIRSQEKVELSAKLKKIVNASLAVVEDRLLNGDYQFDQKSGQAVRKPVNMKDAHKVAVDLQDRQQILEKLDKPEVTDAKIEDKLLTLAEKFAEMATRKIEQKQLEDRTVDAEVVEIKPV